MLVVFPIFELFMSLIIRTVCICLLVVSFTSTQLALANDELSKADSAVANILFDYDGASEFAAYAIREDGFVDIVFARNTPDKLYGEILNKLQNHPDINGVLAGRGGPVCSLF